MKKYWYGNSFPYILVNINYDDMNTTQQYLKQFFEEKNIDNVQYEITDSSGYLHLFDNKVLIDRIMNTSELEQIQIENVLRRIDFRNGSVRHFLKYLAEVMVMQWSKAA